MHAQDCHQVSRESHVFMCITVAHMDKPVRRHKIILHKYLKQWGMKTIATLFALDHVVNIHINYSHSYHTKMKALKCQTLNTVVHLRSIDIHVHVHVARVGCLAVCKY